RDARRRNQNRTSLRMARATPPQLLALCPLPSALCPLPSALCPMPYAQTSYVPANRPTRYIAPVGAGTPPSGSMVTAIAVGLGRSTGVSKIAATRPVVSGRNNHPLLIGGVR